MDLLEACDVLIRRLQYCREGNRFRQNLFHPTMGEVAITVEHWPPVVKCLFCDFHGSIEKLKQHGALCKNHPLQAKITDLENQMELMNRALAKQRPDPETFTTGGPHA